MRKSKAKKVMLACAVSFLLLIIIGGLFLFVPAKHHFTCEHCHNKVYDYAHDILVPISGHNGVDITVCSECAERYEALSDELKFLFLNGD